MYPVAAAFRAEGAGRVPLPGPDQRQDVAGSTRITLQGSLSCWLPA